MQEYIDAWDYLYEPSRYLARTYRYYLAMRPTRLAMAMAKGAPRPPDSLPAYKKTWRTRFYEIRALLTTLCLQGIRQSYRRQFWTQLIGMWKQNPSRFVDYLTACIIGEDLFCLRKIVREKITAIMKERGLEVAGETQRRAASSGI
ncbi:MAG: DUF4070 domain-containing protein, partial [Desulfobaccales bacterium]